MGRHDIFSRSAPRPSRVRFAVSRAAAITLVLAVIAWIGLSILFSPPQASEQVTAVDAAAPAATGQTPAEGDPTETIGTADGSDSAGASASAALTVHVAGAVRRPGVYELAPGARVNDAITAAGGMKPDARPELLNLASPVSDGEQILLPDKDQPAPTPPTAPRQAAASGPGHAASGGQDLVNINQADAETLTRLPGIGPALAGRIIDFRNANGPFASVAELDEVSGIGPVLLERLTPLVTLQ